MPVVHWHYRGHGRSAMPADPNARRHRRARGRSRLPMRAFVGNPPCVLFGHSMGCQVVLEEMRAHREGVRGLVLMCGSYGRVTKTFRGVPILEMILPKIAAAVKKNEGFVRALWERIPSDMTLKLALRAGDLDPEHFNMEDMRPYVTHMRSMDLPMFLRMLTAAGEHSAEDLLPSIDVPDARHRRRTRHLHADLSRRGAREGDAQSGDPRRQERQPRRAARATRNRGREDSSIFARPLVNSRVPAILAFCMLLACRTESGASDAGDAAYDAALSFVFADADPTPTATETSTSVSGEARLRAYASVTPRAGKSIGHTSVVFRLDFDTDAGALRAAYKPEIEARTQTLSRRDRRVSTRQAPRDSERSTGGAARLHARRSSRGASRGDGRAASLFDDEVDRSRRARSGRAHAVDRQARVHAAREPNGDDALEARAPKRRGPARGSQGARGANLDARRVRRAHRKLGSLERRERRHRQENRTRSSSSTTTPSFFDPIPPAFAPQMAMLEGGRPIFARARLTPSRDRRGDARRRVRRRRSGHAAAPRARRRRVRSAAQRDRSRIIDDEDRADAARARSCIFLSGFASQTHALGDAVAIAVPRGRARERKSA